MHHVQYQELASEFFEAGSTDVLNTFMQCAAFELNCCTSYRSLPNAQGSPRKLAEDYGAD
jgi:hypothetical protein